MSTGALSETRLARMHNIMGAHLESGAMPGLVTLISRRGETHVDAMGTLAFGAAEPMRRDSIFRVASLTKPIAAAAAMILVEECRLRLDAPVDRFLPELADRKVLKSIDAPLVETLPAKRAITPRDLLTLRAGYGVVMAPPGRFPIQEAIAEAGFAPGPDLPACGPDEVMQRYGNLPLLHQPGEKWLYNSGSDIVGVLIGRVSGQTLGAFLRERIFEPLGMRDTGFSVPSDKIDRLATCYRTDPANGTPAIFDAARGGRFASPPAFESGAGGLLSTVDDYLAFSSMLLNKGRHGKTRILSRPSVELMTTDQVTPEQKAASPFVPGFWDDRGWGFGLSIMTHRNNLAATPGRFGWDGGYGTSAYSDPKEEMVAILMTQRLFDSPEGPAALQDFWTCVYQTIDD